MLKNSIILASLGSALKLWAVEYYYNLYAVCLMFLADCFEVRRDTIFVWITRTNKWLKIIKKPW